MSATAYDATPATLQNPVPSPTPPYRGGGGSNNRLLIIALAVVTLIALIGPLLAFMLANGDSPVAETVTVGTDEDITVDPAVDPAPVAPVAPVTSGAPVAAAPTVAPVASAPAPAAPAAPAPAPVIKQLAGESPAVYKVTGIAAGSALNVRQSAGTTNPLIGTIAGNATGIAGTGRRVAVDGSEWREIKFNNGTGWVFAGYLAIAPAPVAAATAIPTPTAEVIKDLAADSPAIYSVTGVATGASLNVRADAGTSQRLLGTLPGDTAAIPATGRRALVGDTEWREIGFRSGTGWVNASYLKLVPEAPKTVMLATVASSTVGIVPLTTTNDRLALRADPGYDKNVVGTVGASAVNITATGRLAQIDTEIWAEVTASGTTGWVPRQLTIPVVQSSTDVLSTSGVSAVRIDKVTVAEDGVVTLVIGQQSIKVAATTTVTTAGGSQFSVADWAHVAKAGTSVVAGEVTVVGNQVTRIWIA